ncbi:hypothetical protein BJY01DRAFT_227924 [Aspergillus pseudoustus]|uniref:Leucine rich repeat domain protein n=1 Tax=Aspergillus pseudoustus TaxID=1810923 RepID=A0ABR4INQ0_9EURO
MDSDPPLPPPLRIRHRSPTTSSGSPNNNSGSNSNKPRVHRPSLAKTYRLSSRFDDHSSQPSSDPALFSSDDIPASGLENYHHAPALGSGPGTGSGPRKRRYRGTWWGETVPDAVGSEGLDAQGYGHWHGHGHGRKMKRKRAEFKDKRLVDSGVWMGSDESVSVFASEGDRWGEELLVNSRAEEVRDDDHGHGQGQDGGAMVSTGTRTAFAKKVEEESREHQVARSIVNDCLESGEDSIDLSNGNLRLIPTGLLRPLQHLTKLPTIKEPPITEEVYSSLQPFLRLFLSGNALPSLTGELFELDSLRVLSLRNNKLTEIPPAIRRLTKLQELNISVNRLSLLPWELLWLIKKGDLKHLTVQPNPLSQIEESQISQWHLPTENHEDMKSCEYDGPPPEEAWAPIHVATGPIIRYNMEGVPLSECRSPSFSHTPSNLDSQSQHQAASRVPSLRETALLCFSKSTAFDTDLIPEDDTPGFPNLLLRLLRQARDVRNAGGRSCSICHRSFVIARTEWIEWWDCSTYENGLKGPRASGEKLRPLPFWRLGCSLGCVPASELEA